MPPIFSQKNIKLFVGISTFVFSAFVNAQSSNADILTEKMIDDISQMAKERTAKLVPPNSKIDVKVGTLDSRFKLTSCQKMEPYFLPASPNWGRMRIGIKCLEGEKKWNVSVPLTVDVTTNVLATTSQLPVGTVIDSSHLKEQEANLSTFSVPPMIKKEDAIGRTLARPLAADTVLHIHDFKMKQFYAAGDTVKVVATVNNLQVTISGVAITPGVEGQVARVKTDTGKVLQGKPIGDRLVEVNF